MAFYPPCWGQFEGAFTKIHGGFDRSAHLGSRVSPLFPSRFFPIQSNYSIPLQSVLFTSYRPFFGPSFTTLIGRLALFSLDTLSFRFEKKKNSIRLFSPKWKWNDFDSHLCNRRGLFATRFLVNSTRKILISFFLFLEFLPR